MLVIHGRIKIKAESKDRMLEAAAKIASLSLAEPGCGRYGFATDLADDLTLELFEQWDSQEALNAHFATAHFQEFSEVLLGAVDGTAEFDRYDVSSVSPLFG